MSDRPYLAPNIQKPIINGASMASTVTGPATCIQRIPGISYDISWTGTPTGTFTVQVSNTYVEAPNGNVINAGNWTILPSADFTGNYPAAGGTPGNGFIDVVGTEAAYVQLVYAPSGGTGNLTVVAAAKVL